MAGSTRLEVNFNRLLFQSQTLAENKEHHGWRFEKYIAALNNFLSDLKKAQSKPPQETLQEYQKQVDLLKGLMEAEKKPCITERALITDRLRPVSAEIQNGLGKRIQAKAKARCEEDLRAELLGTPKSVSKDDDKSGVRHRGVTKDVQEEEDINTILQHHHRLQERLAQEMLMHTQALKQNITDAGRVVRDDTRKIHESTRLADTNMGKLKVESERLEAHTKTCSWWIWLMLGIVMIVFIWMVLFMKLFSKPVS